MGMENELRKLAYWGKLLSGVAGKLGNVISKNKLMTAGTLATVGFGGAAAKGQYNSYKDQFKQRHEELQGTPPSVEGQ